MQLLVNVDVDDLGRAARFYTEALGLRVGRRFGAFGVEMLGASSAIYLLAKPQGSRAAESTAQARSYARHWTPIHLDFVVDDLEAAVEKARSAGARPEGEPRTAVWGRIAQFADPFGHGFCLVQFLNRGYDEIAS